MKKIILFVAALLLTGGVVQSQVRIGGNAAPHGAAVLDLNADNNATPTGNKRAFALPRVSLGALSGTSANLNGTTPLNGMLVYNTNPIFATGVYYWDTNKWVKISDGSFTEVDGIIGNEITDTIANGGLTRSGAGTAASPYKVGIKSGGIQTSMIANGAVTGAKIADSTIRAENMWGPGGSVFLRTDSTGRVNWGESSNIVPIELAAVIDSFDYGSVVRYNIYALNNHIYGGYTYEVSVPQLRWIRYKLVVCYGTLSTIVQNVAEGYMFVYANRNAGTNVNLALASCFRLK